MLQCPTVLHQHGIWRAYKGLVRLGPAAQVRPVHRLDVENFFLASVKTINPTTLGSELSCRFSSRCSACSFVYWRMETGDSLLSHLPIKSSS